MKYLSTLVLSFLFISLSAQIPDYFEFADQDYANHEIIHISSLDDKVIFASNDHAGGTRITITDSLHQHQNYDITRYVNYHEGKMHTISNNDKFFHLIKPFDCDYATGGSYLAKITNDSLEEIQFEETDIPDVDRGAHIDACVVYDQDTNKDFIYVLNGILVIIYDLEGSFQDSIEIDVLSLFAFDNEVYYLHKNRNDIVKLATDEIVYTSDENIIDIKQIEDELVLITDEISVFDFNSKTITNSVSIDDLELKIGRSNFYPTRSITKVGEELVFIAKQLDDNNAVFTTDFSNDQILKLYSEDCIDFNPFYIHYEDEFYHFGLIGHTNVIRRIKEMKDYPYDRVNITLSDSVFYETIIDTFIIHQTTMDTIYTSFYYFNMEVDVHNAGLNTIEKIAFHSQIEWYPQPHCEPYRIDLFDEVNILNDETYRLKSNSTYFYTLFDTVALYIAGANYKLNEDCVMEVLIAPLPVQTDDISSNQLPIKVYPNPTQDILILELEECNRGTLEIFDIAGKSILTKALNSLDQQRVDVKELEKGIYFLRVLSSDRQYEIKSFVKN